MPRTRTATKRVRPRASTSTDPAASEIVEQKLKDLRNLMIRDEALKLEIEEATAELERHMKAAKLTKLSLKDIVAEIKASAGRATTTIDPEKFYESVKLGDFFECVKVSVTKAREYLSGKELASISTVTPAVKGPEKLVVKMVKPTKGDN